MRIVLPVGRSVPLELIKIQERKPKPQVKVCSLCFAETFFNETVIEDENRYTMRTSRWKDQIRTWPKGKLHYNANFLPKEGNAFWFLRSPWWYMVWAFQARCDCQWFALATAIGLIEPSCVSKPVIPSMKTTQCYFLRWQHTCPTTEGYLRIGRVS